MILNLKLLIQSAPIKAKINTRYIGPLFQLGKQKFICELTALECNKVTLWGRGRFGVKQKV